MGLLKGDDLVYIYGHMKPNYRQLARKDRLWFAFANREEGRKGHDILKRVYSDYYVESGDLANPTDFNIKFSSQQAAEWVLSDIDDSISSYGSYHPDTGLGYEAGTGTGGGTKTDSDPVKNKKATDWITYLVVGVAAVVILLLLWDSKK